MRAIDTNVLVLINLAASSANAGINFTGGGVVRFVNTLGGSERSLQRLTVNFHPPNVATLARWTLPALSSSFLGTNGQQATLFAPTNVVVSFNDVPGYLTPTNFPVALKANQDAVLDVTYTPPAVAPPVLSGTRDGLRVSGPTGTKVQLQFRSALDIKTVWADVPAKRFTLGNSPVSLLTSAEANARPGFYRVVVIP